MDEKELQKAMLRAAARCREVVDGCLFEFEWKDVEEEFQRIIGEELRQHLGIGHEH